MACRFPSRSKSQPSYRRSVTEEMEETMDHKEVVHLTEEEMVMTGKVSITVYKTSLQSCVLL